MCDSLKRKLQSFKKHQKYNISYFLDVNDIFFSFQKNATGKELFDKVCAYLTLQEKDYFGLQYQNNNVKVSIQENKFVLRYMNQPDDIRRRKTIFECCFFGIFFIHANHVTETGFDYCVFIAKLVKQQ